MSQTLSYAIVDLVHIQILYIRGEYPIEQLRTPHECLTYAVRRDAPAGIGETAHNVQDLLSRV